MRLERELTLALPLALEGPAADRERLEGYLQNPGRVLQDLLRSRKLKSLPRGRFRHVPRPIVLGPLNLRPRVVLQTHWRAPTLTIQLQDYELQGLESLQKRIQFSFDSQIQACEGLLQLSAKASLDVGSEGLATFVPQPVQRVLADRLLQLILDRLQQRCLNLLPQGLQQWHQESDHVGGSSRLLPT